MGPAAVSSVRLITSLLPAVLYLPRVISEADEVFASEDSSLRRVLNVYLPPSLC